MGKYLDEIISQREKVAVGKCLGEILSGGILSGEKLSWCEIVGWKNIRVRYCRCGKKSR